VKVAAASSLGAGLSLEAKPQADAQAEAQHEHAAQADGPLSGPLAAAVVNFGSWTSDPPQDRFPNVSLASQNFSLITPYEVTIKAGGAVTFVIGGLHQVIVYGDGTQPGDINTRLTAPTTGTPAGVPTINDPTNRVYRGLDPSLFPRDRVEPVHFPDPGTYLVICGIVSHFTAGMYSYVRVLP
jgi:plastocyanin